MEGGKKKQKKSSRGGKKVLVYFAFSGGHILPVYVWQKSKMWNSLEKAVGFLKGNKKMYIVWSVRVIFYQCLYSKKVSCGILKGWRRAKKSKKVYKG